MAEKDQTAKAGVVIGTGAAIAAALALLAKREARAAVPEGVLSLDEPTMKLLIAIAEASGESLDAIKDVYSAIKSLSIQVQGYVPNAEGIVAARVQIAVINRWYRFPDIVVPDDMELQIKGWPTNAGIIYVAGSRSAATNINQVWPLLANEAVGYRVKNAQEIYVSGTVAGDWVVCTVEQRKRGG